MPVRNIKNYIAAVAAAAAIAFGATATAVASAGFVSAPASAMRDDPHATFDDDAQSAVLCATAIEYGLIAA